MKYYVTIGGKEFIVDLENGAGSEGAVVTTENRAVGVELRGFRSPAAGRQPPASLSLTAQTLPAAGAKGGPVQVRVSLLAATTASPESSLRLLVDNRLVEARVETERDRLRARLRPSQAKGGRTALSSALPGVIRRILRRPGEKVASGTPILTLEAMKMENEVQAEAEGRILAILVREGQVVNAGDVLVEIDAS